METFAEYADAAGLDTISWEDDDLALDVIAMFHGYYGQSLAMGQRNGAPMILDVHLIDRPGFNAFAGSFADADVIAIFRDVPLLLLKIARSMVSHGIILSHIRTESVKLEPFAVPGRYAELLSSVRVWEVQALADPKREDLAKKIAALACLFILGHEFAHIYNGHADYLEKHLGLTLVAEVQGESLPSPATYERETLEWDADSTASEQVLACATRADKRVVGGRDVWTLPENNWIGTRDDAIHIALISQMVCGFFALGADNPDILDPAPRTHPHARFRMMSMIDMMAHVLSYRTGQPEIAFVPVISSAMKQFTTTLDLTFQVRKDHAAPDKEAVAAARSARIKLWEANWAKMHSELDTLKRGGTLAPPVQMPHPAYPTNPTKG
ncbi:hypothetical protein E5673_08180 [Sphingomonas sp. PAMC26645]|uniref:hypothetical protein n=1 Tax=Sphingomonas sp. PAMC26645 TaxID=2565555 RepID=UPI00109DF79D|nr:hypothetical protein [Sphingomonas sp. PAMC26645]QCB42210.1 hypothetical protein E5673_08180 [Sphingomonas sp. PAMC26645]